MPLDDSFFKGKKVLITGVCGTVGSQLARHLLNETEISELVGLDNNESLLFFLEQDLNQGDRTNFFLADMRDGAKLTRMMQGIDMVFHAAALKHVALCERSPYEAVQTNILGVQNVINAAMKCDVERVIFTSSDKAVNPTNVMGTSKLMGERLMTAYNLKQRRRGPVLASTRFGNVMGSSGSVVPVFSGQIRSGGPVTLTDPGMTRFIMSVKMAVDLILDSAVLACGGEVFITKMPVIRIEDLARVMIGEMTRGSGKNAADIRIEVTGVKPGEKMYEELMTGEETRRAWELPAYYVVLPAFRGLYKDISYDYRDIVSRRVDSPYNSATGTPMTRDELAGFLKENNLLKVEA